VTTTDLPDDIDPGIRPLVELLNRNGLKTTASCQGGEGHEWRRPAVRVVPSESRPQALHALADELARVLIQHGYTGFSIGCVHHYQSAALPWRPAEMSYVEVDFWSDDWEGLRECDCDRCVHFVGTWEAAEILGVKPGTLRVWCTRGKLSVAKYVNSDDQQTQALYLHSDIVALAKRRVMPTDLRRTE
jgi:hypothetical protein